MLVAGLPIFNIGFPHQFVVQTMETAFNKCNSLTSRETSGGAHCAHHGFRARVSKTHFVYVRTQGFDLLDHFCVKLGGKTGQGCGLFDLSNDGIIHTRVLVTQNDRSVTQSEINIGFAIAVSQFATLGVLNEDSFIVAPIAVVLCHALRHVQMRFLHQLLLLHG